MKIDNVHRGNRLARPVSDMLPIPDGCRHVLIAGPTAAGKSAMAMQMARETGGVVVNADALQVYSCWRVLTARPTPEEEGEIDHVLYGHVDYQTRYSVGNWLEDVTTVIRHHKDRVLIFTGGTGLYLSCLVNGIAPIPEISEDVMLRCDEQMAAGGMESLLADLVERDPDTVRQIDRTNPARIRRAWEVLQSTGKGMAFWHDQTGRPLVDLQNAMALVVEIDPQTLSCRIEHRLKQMADSGALDECRMLKQFWNPSLPASRALGAREFMASLDGSITLEEAISQAAIATRQYAKRQRTWFRNRMKGWKRV